MIVVFPHAGYAQKGNVVVAVGLHERYRHHQLRLRGTLRQRLRDAWRQRLRDAWRQRLRDARWQRLRDARWQRLRAGIRGNRVGTSDHL